jgi:diacylglycerol kinase (ATP)
MKIHLIFNPAAGQRDFYEQILLAQKSFEKDGHLTRLKITQRRGDGTVLARQSVEEGADVCVGIGGDGTVSEVVNGIAGSSVRLGVIPIGTANVFAVDTGIPLWSPLRLNSVLDAAQIINTGHTQALDLGRVTVANGNQRYFLMWSGIGIDAAITEEVKPEDTRRLGFFAWIASGVMVATSYLSPKGTIHIDGDMHRHRIFSAIVSNGQLYGRLWRLAPTAKMNDGLLDVTVFDGYGMASTALNLAMLTVGRYAETPSLHFYKAKSLWVNAGRPLPVHADSEPIGMTPAHIEIMPKALNVILPPKIPQHLLV